MYHRWDPNIHTECLKYLIKRELWDLLGDDETLQCIAKNTPKFQELQKQKEVLSISVCKLAEQNLSYQPYLNYNKVLLAERYQLLGQLITTVRHKKKELNKLNGQLSLKETHQLLKEKVAHLKDESEGLGQNFVEGRMLLIDFVTSFQNLQKFYYTYLVQLEKMQNFHMQTKRNWIKKELLPNDHLVQSIHSTASIHVSYSLTPYYSNKPP